MSLNPAFRHALRVVTLFICTLCATSSLAQKVDAEFLRAISTIYAGGFTGQIIKEWCDERVPNLSDQNAKLLEAWRVKMDLPAIDARLTTLIGEQGKQNVNASLEDKRGAFYEQLDKSSTNPETDCAELGKALNDDFNLKVLYANEYKIVAAQPAASNGNTGSSTDANTGTGKGTTPDKNSGTTGSGTGSSTTAPASKLPALPAFDYTKFAKLKLNPEKEPIPDEYHCYPEIRGEKYATSSLTLQILPGRKYRAGIGSSVSEGNFKMDGYDLFITSGAFASKRKHYYSFNRKEGAEI